jgi:hypothetical protein
MPQIPPDAMAKLERLPPEQRAQVEAMMKQRMGGGAATPRMRQTCVTQDKLDKTAFSEENKSCERTIAQSTPALVQFHEECSESDGSKRVVDAKFEMTGADSMRGSMQVKATTKDNKTMNMNFGMSGKWLGADCSGLKKN